jgi:hypothetical protein
VEINYELKPNDFFIFGKETAKTKKSHNPMVTIYAITYLLFIFADILYALFSGSTGKWSPDGLLLGICLRIIIAFVVLLIVSGFIRLIVRKKGKDVLKELPNGLFCEHKIILAENELIELTDVNTSRYSWKAIGEIKETESFVLIDILMSGTYIIPKRYFQAPEQIKSFIETASYYRQNAENSFQLSHMTEYEKSLQ